MMVEMFKKIDLREDGFIELTLKRVKDFDDYIYSQIQKDGSCLACVRDHRSKSKFYYDTKGYLTLKDYLHSHMFDKGEVLAFLIYILEFLVKANTSKPVSMQLEHIFISYDGNNVRFLVFPIQLDHWVFQKEESKQFLRLFIQEVRIVEGYEAIGYLAYAMKQPEVRLPSILQGLHDIQQQCIKKPTFIEKLLRLDTKEEYFIRNIPPQISYPENASNPMVLEEPTHFQVDENRKEESLHRETVDLFKEDDEGAYLEDVVSKEKVVIFNDTFTIGRNIDNSLVIAHSYVSSYHAVIKEKKYLEDLQSSNGTHVNDHKITTCELHHGDNIKFANKCYEFKEFL